ncbi:hypothetical protein ACFQL4_15785 [Halosimplex aquaticum]
MLLRAHSPTASVALWLGCGLVMLLHRYDVGREIRSRIRIVGDWVRRGARPPG